MKATDTYLWLMEHGGPVIRYRTATELMPPDMAIDVQPLLSDMLQSPTTREWLDRLVPIPILTGWPEIQRLHIFASMQLHSNKQNAIETVIGKLTDFGLRKGIPEFDRRMEPYLAWIEQKDPLDHIYDRSMKMILIGFLSLAGYFTEPSVKKVMQQRLETVYDFTRKGDYDIYVPGRNIGTKPVVTKELLTNPGMKIPTMYDIIGWAAYIPRIGTIEEKARADTIIDYIINDEYQNFSIGYGYGELEPGRSWSLGWSVHLPNYPGTRSYIKSVVFMLDLLMNFHAARQSKWLKDSINHLEEFRSGDGTYLFPRAYLPEVKIGMWMSGTHMALEDNRRLNKAIEIESTFWMAKFQKALEE
jgi:hypothetical protein